MASVEAHPKVRFARGIALDVAREVLRAIEPFAERLIVAGSLRRRKAEVGDVEILYIARCELVRDGLFDTKRVDLVERALDGLLANGTLKKRRNEIGAELWGPKNKLAVHCGSGVPVDLFAATSSNWFNYLVCRTGSAQLNRLIATMAQRKGWKWHPYGCGFTDQEGRWCC